MDTYRIRPLIETRELWRGEKQEPGFDPSSTITRPLFPDRADTLVHTEMGNVRCCCPQTGEVRDLIFQGFEADRDTLKYRCPAAYVGSACPGAETCHAVADSPASATPDRESPAGSAGAQGSSKPEKPRCRRQETSAASPPTAAGTLTPSPEIRTVSSGRWRIDTYENVSLLNTLDYAAGVTVVPADIGASIRTGRDPAIRITSARGAGSQIGRGVTDGLSGRCGLRQDG